MVAPRVPYPPIYGAGIRNLQLLEYLTARHRVSLLAADSALDPNGGAARDYFRTLGVRLTTVPGRQAAAKRLVQLASVPTTRSHFGRIVCTAPMQRQLDVLAAGSRFDAILFAGSILGGLRVADRTPLVIDEHNVEFDVMRRTWAGDASLPRRAFAYLEYQKFRREEVAACNRAAWCTFTSEPDRALMVTQASLRGSSVVPNGVDLDAYRPDQTPVDPELVVFSGNMGYRPNADAVLYFVRSILPSIQKRRPTVKFVVVGADPPSDVARLANDRVVITGRVADVRDYTRTAAVLVAPLRVGGGTRLKILEGLALAKPVVSTSVGCEGIDVIPGTHLVVADSPAAFAEAVLSMLDAPEPAARLGRAGRTLVEQRYGWARSGALMEAALESARSSTRGVTLPRA